MTMQRIRLIAISRGIEGSLFAFSCCGSLVTSIYYGSHFPVVLVFVVLHVHNVVSFHSFYEV